MRRVRVEGGGEGGECVRHSVVGGGAWGAEGVGLGGKNLENLKAKKTRILLLSCY